MWESIFWLVLNLGMIAWNLTSPSSTSKGVVLTLLTISTIIQLVVIYGQLHTL